MALTMLFGGARSGKSALAVELGRRHDGPVTYIATAPAVDDDMRARIIRHQAERPPAWTTVEEPIELAGAVADAPGSMILIDCLTLWVSNLMESDGASDDAIRRLAVETAAGAAGVPGPVVAISNEVGLGVHPETHLGRRYRDVLGRVNQVWAAAAERSLLLVAGRAIPLDDPWRHLG